jgi:hypothetical protein
VEALPAADPIPREGGRVVIGNLGNLHDRFVSSDELTIGVTDGEHPLVIEAAPEDRRH